MLHQSPSHYPRLARAFGTSLRVGLELRPCDFSDYLDRIETAEAELASKRSAGFLELRGLIERATTPLGVQHLFNTHSITFLLLDGPEFREIEELRREKMARLTRERNEQRVAEAA